MSLDAIFKAYDVRGLYPEEIDEALARRIGNAFAHFTGAQQVIVGHDMRPSSIPLTAAFIEGATQAGADVTDIGLCSTDVVYFAAGKLDAPGAMFTASHNPAQYNGIKLCRAGAAPVGERAATLDRAANRIEANRGALIALLQAEGGKTLDDCVAEVREAADFCRYYAVEARRSLVPEAMPGPTGETNELRYRARGVFVCISPWNFPLAIFTGQIAAALVAGNAVVAKPAEQTPFVAAAVVRLFHAAGAPASALHLVPGDGRIGDLLVRDRRAAGIVFTGSTETARKINRALVERGGPLVSLIAETGGINALIADASALPEQLTDDVLASAFRSAGQRCSALRLLCLQEDIAASALDVIIGAAQEMRIGDPRDLATHVGPVIDADAKVRIDRWITAMDGQGRVLFRSDRIRPLPAAGAFVPLAIIELDRARDLKEEVFGPVPDRPLPPNGWVPTTAPIMLRLT